MDLENRNKQIIEDAKAGMRVTEIADKNNCSKKVVYNVLRKNKIKITASRLINSDYSNIFSLLNEGYTHAEVSEMTHYSIPAIKYAKKKLLR